MPRFCLTSLLLSICLVSCSNEITLGPDMREIDKPSKESLDELRSKFDTDQDGLTDNVDVCPADPANDIDRDGVCAILLADLDGDDCVSLSDQLLLRDRQGEMGEGLLGDILPDGIIDEFDLRVLELELGQCQDNCPTLSNVEQVDENGDGVGDVCEDLVCPSNLCSDQDPVSENFCETGDAVLCAVDIAGCWLESARETCEFGCNAGKCLPEPTPTPTPTPTATPTPTPTPNPGGRFPLRVSADGRQLLTASNDPIFLRGATPWHMIARLDRTETIAFLDDRQSQGFNALVLSLVVSDDYWTSSSDNAYGDPPFLVKNDFSTPNEAYFSHADWVLDQALQRGMAVLLFPAYIGWECRIQGWCDEMKANGLAKLREYGRFLGNRYKNQSNILWIEGGDTAASLYSALDEVEAVIDGILEFDSVHIHSGHSSRQRSAMDDYNRYWLGFNTTYSNCTQTPRKLEIDYGDRSPVMPTVYIEGQYEYHSLATPVCLRSQAYWSLLGGASGHFFGSERIWDFESGWESSVHSPGTQSMERFHALVQSRPAGTLVPDYNHTVLTAGYGSIDGLDYASAARASNGDTTIVYSPSQKTLSIDMAKVSGSQAKVYWFNPRNGGSTLVGTYATSGIRTFTPSSSGDWVLVLDNAARGFGPPGQ